MFKEMNEKNMRKINGGAGRDEDPSDCLTAAMGGVPRGVGKIDKHYGPVHYVKNLKSI